MDLFFTCPSNKSRSALISAVILILYWSIFVAPILSQKTHCRTSCGGIPIQYPFGIDDGCGSSYYRRLLVCTELGALELRTPSGRYPVRNISYSDPHLLVTDPFMWTCQDMDNFRPTRAFSLDTSTHLSLSPQNDYLFFNCSERDVIVEPKPMFCERFPDRCDSSCDSSSYLCRHLPECESALRDSSCCSYYPKATESLRMMLRHCASYTSVYWRNVGTNPYNQVAEYGIRVDFDIPVTTHCLQCEDIMKGGGTCGFDTQTENFLCLCEDKNITSYCKDHGTSGHTSTGVIAGNGTSDDYFYQKAVSPYFDYISGVSVTPSFKITSHSDVDSNLISWFGWFSGTVTAVTAAGAIGVGAGIWFFKKVRATAPVTCGVQTNENRLF